MRNIVCICLTLMLASCASTTNNIEQQDTTYLRITSNQQVTLEFEYSDTTQCTNEHDAYTAMLAPLIKKIKSQPQPPTWTAQCVKSTVGITELPYKGTFKNKQTGQVNNALFKSEKTCLFFKTTLEQQLGTYEISCNINNDFGKIRCQSDSDCEKNFSCRSTKAGGTECRKIIEVQKVDTNNLSHRQDKQP